MTIISNYHDLCRQVLDLDKSIRFTSVATLEGKILATLYREGVQSLLSLQESELSIMQSLIRMNILQALEQKLGKTIYMIEACEKIKRATIAIFNEKEEENGGEKYYDSYLIISFEKEAANVESIINDKILPLLSRSKIGKGLNKV